MNRNLLSVWLIFYVFLTSCSTENKPQNNQGLQRFDISPSGDKIMYTWKVGNRNYLFESNILGVEVKMLMKFEKRLEPFNAKYSFDGEKILFLVRGLDTYDGAVWAADVDGRNALQLTDSIGIKTEAVFSKSGNIVYFAMAKEYANYSPIARKAAHDFDLYSIDLARKITKKISSLNAYNISFVSEVDSVNLLMSLQDDQDGAFFYNKETFILERISSKNDTLTHSNGYSNLVLIDRNTMLASSYTDLVKVDLRTRLEITIQNSKGSGFKTVCFNKNLGKIFFQLETDSDRIHSINLDGSELRDIVLSIPQ